MVRPIPAEIYAVFACSCHQTQGIPKIRFGTYSLLRPLHAAKNLCPTLFHTATVEPKRRGHSLLYRTPLN